jgi:ankyrin repeat protein
MIHNYHPITIAAGILMPLLGLAVTGCSAHPPRPADAFTDPGARALAEAAQRGDVKEIDRLATSGVDVNATGKFGVTPLFCALSSRNHEGFLRLLELGANPDNQIPELDFGRGSSVTSIPRCADAAVLVDAKNPDAAIGGRPTLKDAGGLIVGRIIHGHQFPVAESLAHERA